MPQYGTAVHNTSQDFPTLESYQWPLCNEWGDCVFIPSRSGHDDVITAIWDKELSGVLVSLN